MTQTEFVAWREFYRQQPFDDLHRFHRPAALVATSMAGGDVKARLDWLAPEPVPAGYDNAELSVFKAFNIQPPPRKA